MSFCIGVVFGTLGVGLGLLYVPIFLLIGIHPRIASATVGIIYFFISSSEIIQVLLENILPLDVIIFFTVLAFVSGLTITNYLYDVVIKY
jgi:uncharacterized membrane protein YfcA